MTAYTLIGVAAAVAFAYFAGDFALDGLRRRICLLTELNGFAEKSAVGIAEYKLTLSAIKSETDAPMLTECGFFGWLEHGCMDEDGLPPLTADEREAVSSFVSGFGKCFADEQAALCRSLADRMADALGKAKSEYETKSKIMRTLPPLSVMSLLILLF